MNSQPGSIADLVASIPGNKTSKARMTTFIGSELKVTGVKTL